MSELHQQFWPSLLPRTLTVPQTSIFFNLEVSARRYPDKAALIYYDHVISYARLLAEAERLAGFLQQRCGVKKGDRVALFMQNSPQFVIAYYAVLRADACVVPVNPMNRTEELRHYFADSGATTAFVSQELWPLAAPLVGQIVSQAIVACYADYIDAATDLPLPEFVSAPRQPINGAGVTLWTDALAADLAPGASSVGPDDLCVMPYTSGTTGHPKGCMHPHRTVMFTLVAQALWIPTRPDSVILAVLPFFHVTGMQGAMNGPIYAGSTVVLLPRWDRNVAAQLIERYRVTGWTNIATMMIDFLMNPRLAEYDLSSVLVVGGGGAAMPEAVAQKLNDRYGLSYIEGYGLSETMAPTHINPMERPKKQCLGIPIFDTDSRVVDPMTLAELPQGEVGEIISSGPQVFLGYWNNDEANRQCFVDIDGKRFFRTGDLARVDEDGYFFMVDRLKRMINASGFKVWPAEVEAMLYAHPAIQEACIIGARDAHRGETVKAVVVLKPEARGVVSGEEIIAWAREAMAAYKVPHIVEFVETLPKSATGKVQWRALQEKEMGAP